MGVQIPHPWELSIYPRRLLLATALLAGMALAACGAGGPGMHRTDRTQFASNGERIYFTATSDSGDVIAYNGGPAREDRTGRRQPRWPWAVGDLPVAALALRPRDSHTMVAGRAQTGRIEANAPGARNQETRVGARVSGLVRTGRTSRAG